MKKIAIIGIQGLPAHYGGFETLAENLVRRMSGVDAEFTVFCSGKDLPTEHNVFFNSRLVYLPFHSNGVQSIIYDIVSMIKCIRGYDSILVLGVSGCIFIPIYKFLSKTKVVINIDGLEHKRAKWGCLAKWFLRFSERMAVLNADIIIADNVAIQEYVEEVYSMPSTMIAYGGDHVIRGIPEEKQIEILDRFGLISGGYFLTICRIEPENNVEMILEAIIKKDKKFVLVGNFNRKGYASLIKKKYENHNNIRLINACYDLDVLFALRNNACCYIHGHSAGGTNPSIVEAMHFGKPILAFDVHYNRNTTNHLATYFSCQEDLERLLDESFLEKPVFVDFAKQNYSWENIVCKYKEILL